MFGDELTGRTFQMETTDTNDNSSAIISFMVKPLLADQRKDRPDLQKRLMKIQYGWETLGNYDILVATKSDEFGTYPDELVSMAGNGPVWGTYTGDYPMIWGQFVWGVQTAKKTFSRPNHHGYYFLARVKNETADRPWKVSRISTMSRLRPRYQHIGAR